jgi:hypothetical protein
MVLFAQFRVISWIVLLLGAGKSLDHTRTVLELAAVTKSRIRDRIREGQARLFLLEEAFDIVAEFRD